MVPRSSNRTFAFTKVYRAKFRWVVSTAENSVPAPTIKYKKVSIVKSQLQLPANFGIFREFAHWTIPHFRCFSVLEGLVTNRV